MMINELTSGAGLVIRIVRWFYTNWEHTKLRFQSYTKYRNRRVRISMAYLFRIKVGDDYLLVRSNRIRDQFQPVGGVYKYYQGAKGILDSFGAVSDVFVGHDKDSRNDLRRVLQKGSKLPAFLKWFHSKRNREHDPSREFREELVTEGIVDPYLFSHVNSQLVRSIGIGIRYSPELEIDEYLFADVFELLPTTEQEESLEELKKVNSDKYRFVDERCIRSYGQTCDIRIGSHTWQTLEGCVKPPHRS